MTSGISQRWLAFAKPRQVNFFFTSPVPRLLHPPCRLLKNRFLHRCLCIDFAWILLTRIIRFTFGVTAALDRSGRISQNTQSVVSLGACIKARDGHTIYWSILSCRNLAKWSSFPHNFFTCNFGVSETYFKIYGILFVLSVKPSQPH